MKSNSFYLSSFTPRMIACAVALGVASPSWAQAMAPEMDHGAMDHGAMTPAPQTPAKTQAPTEPASAHPHDAASMAQPMGRLPSSDGSAGRSYADLGIHAHSMNSTTTNSLTLDKFGLTHSRDGQTGVQWDGDFWLGNATDKLWIKSEGERTAGRTEGAKVEAFWSHAVTPFWDLQVGARRDFGATEKRNWAALGVQGTAPYDVATEITAYVGPTGRSALYLHGEHDLALTQKLILTPELEANLFGKNDRAFGVGAGVSDVQATLTLRYEFTPRFAPYIGMAFDRKLGRTASYASRAGESRSERSLLAGVRLTF